MTREDYTSLIPDVGAPRLYDGPARFSTHDLLATEFARHGCTSVETGGVLVVSKGDAVCAFVESETSFTSLVGYRILKDKRLANRFLSRAGIGVAEQHSFGRGRFAEAERVVARLGSAVVKPASGNKGRGVTVGVTVDTFREAWDLATAISPSVLVESHFRGGIEARYLVIDGACVSVVRRLPPHVRGDGAHTIAALIEMRNAVRLRNPHLSSRPIIMDAHRLRVLASQGYDLSSVPASGQAVVLDTKAGLSTGGDAMDITDDVHPGMRAVAERAAGVMPGLDVIGFDILARDHGLPPDPAGYIVVEGNTRPGLGGHVYPSYGQPREVASFIAAACLRKMGPALPPAVQTAVAQPRSAAIPMPETAGGDDAGLPVVAVAPRDGPRSGTGSLVLGGDTCLGHSYLTQRWPDARDRLLGAPESFFEGLLPVISDRDALVVNLETVLADAPPDLFGGKKRYLGWDAPDRTLSVLRSVGVDAVTLANNHAMDFGPDRAAETVAHLARAGIAAAGFGATAARAAAPLQLSIGGVTVLVFSAFEIRSSYRDDFGFYAGRRRPGVRGFGEGPNSSIGQVIRPYREAYPESFIIFAPHWGGARNYGWATDRMARIGEAALTAGADAVIGHGAHALQELDRSGDGTVVFSLGNFVFNSPGRYAAMDGLPYSLVARLQLAPGKARLRLYPFFCDNRVSGFRNRPVTDAEFDEVLATLERRPIPHGPLRDAFGPGRDERGFYLETRGALSPRFGTMRAD